MLFFICELIYPKAVVDDELWASVEIQKEFSLIKIEIEQQLRYNEHYSQFHKTFTDFSLSYINLPIVEFSGKFRYIIYDDKEKSRIGVSCTIDPNITFFIPNFKFKVQRDYEKDKDPDDLVIRNKFTFEYPLTEKCIPYTSWEVFHKVEEDSLNYDKYRISIGFEYELSESQSIELFYKYKQELKKSEDEITNIIGLKYEYTF